MFTLVPASEATDVRVYGPKFVDTNKNEGKPDVLEKSRLVVQAYNDEDHGYLTHTLTGQQVSQRLLSALCAIDSIANFLLSLETYHKHTYNLKLQLDVLYMCVHQNVRSFLLKSSLESTVCCMESQKQVFIGFKLTTTFTNNNCLFSHPSTIHVFFIQANACLKIKPKTNFCQGSLACRQVTLPVPEMLVSLKTKQRWRQDLTASQRCPYAMEKIDVK